MAPLVTVVIPVYQGEAYIMEALDSVLSQTGVDFEVLVGDNASTDGTVALLRRYHDSRLRILTSEINLGIFGNLNRLICEAKAPLIKILCADDWLLPNGLARQVAHILSQPGAAFSACWPAGAAAGYAPTGHFALQGKLPSFIHPKAAPLVFLTFGNVAGNLTQIIFRRDLLQASGGFDQSLPYAGDFEMWSRLALRHAFSIQPEELVYVRQHPNQNSFLLNKRNELAEQVDRVVGALYVELGANDQNLLLRYHLTYNYIVRHWYRGAQIVLHGSLAGFKPALKARDFGLPRPLPLLLAFLTLGGRLGRDAAPRRLLRRIETLNREQDPVRVPIKTLENSIVR